MTAVATRGNLVLVDDGDGIGHIEGTDERKPLGSFLKWGYWKPVLTAASGPIPGEEPLVRKYEQILERNAKRCKRNYLRSSQVVTAAGEEQNRNPLLGEVLDEDALAESATAAKAQQTKIAEEAARQLALEMGISFAIVNPYIKDLVLAQAGRQAERIVEGVREIVAKLILESITEGWSVPQAADQIYGALHEAKPWQATMLARTDLMAMKNGGSFAAASALGDAAPLYKRWKNADDERVRPTHVQAEDQVVPLAGTFTVGEAQLVFPGDPSGPDGEVINCRCTIVYTDNPAVMVSAGWDEGEHPRDPGGEGGGEFVEKGTSAEGADLWKGPLDDGDWGAILKLQEAGKDAEAEAAIQEARARKNAWVYSVRSALARGDLSIEDAVARGYHADGVEHNDMGYTWGPLPDETFHATINAPAVLKDGLLTRDERGGVGGGLGGGSSQDISLTTNPQYAEDIAVTLRELNSVLTEKTTVQTLIDNATTGVGADRPWIDKIPDVDMKEIRKLAAGDHTNYEGKPFTPDELDWARYKAYTTLTGYYRQEAGGSESTVPFTPNLNVIKAADPADIRVVRVRPKPGARGFFVSNAEAEWRVPTGKVLQVEDAVRAAAWDESKHPRDPGGEGGGEWVKGGGLDDMVDRFKSAVAKHVGSEVKVTKATGQRPVEGQLMRLAPNGLVVAGVGIVPYDQIEAMEVDGQEVSFAQPGPADLDAEWVDPPEPRGINKGKGGAGGYTSDRAESSMTSLGRTGEHLFTQIVAGDVNGDVEIVHPPGAGEKSPLDVRADGWGFEVKTVSADATSFKATPKPYEQAQKEKAAADQGLKGGIAIVVLDREAKVARAYYREGFKGGRLSENTGWKYIGETGLTAAGFDESEHPRNPDGKFRYKTEGLDVVDTQKGQVVERHRDAAAAEKATKRLNRQCLICGVVAPNHAPNCPLRLFERDPDFGAEYDDDEMTAAGWDESEHPRHPSGTEKGGKFAPKSLGTALAETKDDPLPERSWLALQDLKPGTIFKFHGQDPGGVRSIQWYEFKGKDDQGRWYLEGVDGTDVMTLPGDIDDIRVDVAGTITGAFGTELPLEIPNEIHESEFSSSHPLWEVEMDDGMWYVKSVDESQNVTQLRDYVPPGRDLQRELAAQIMAEEIRKASPGLGMDLHVAEYREGNIRGLGHVGMSKAVPGDSGEQFPGYDSLSEPEARALSLFDWTIGNTDRHMGNFVMTDNGRAVAIDNGLSFPAANLGRQGQFHIIDWRQDGEHLKFPNSPQGTAIGEMLNDWERIDARLAPLLTEDERRAMWRRLEYTNNGTGQLGTQNDWNNGEVDQLVHGAGWHDAVTLGREDAPDPPPFRPGGEWEGQLDE